MSKLTLHVPDELIAAAKVEAAARQVSVSKLVTDYFRNLAANSPSAISGERLAPRTQRLAGCLPASAGAEREEYLDYLEKKHS